jgi:hypothetical protein
MGWMDGWVGTSVGESSVRVKDGMGWGWVKWMGGRCWRLISFEGICFLSFFVFSLAGCIIDLRFLTTGKPVFDQYDNLLEILRWIGKNVVLI